MQSREEVVATLQRCKGEIAARFHVNRIGIFGSVAQGGNAEASDIGSPRPGSSPSSSSKSTSPDAREIGGPRSGNRGGRVSPRGRSAAGLTGVKE